MQPAFYSTLSLPAGLVLFTVIIITQYLVLWALVKFNFKNHGAVQGYFPEVALMIPCRDEQANLDRCLASVAKLNYPEDKLQVLLADDGSQDNTGSIIRDWVKDRANWYQVPILPQTKIKINGKANALVQMLQHTNAEMLLFTDADCKLPSTWINEMLAAIKIPYGLVTGITMVEGNSFFAKMQGIDWWLTLGKIKAVSDLGYNLTAMGNNMLIHRSAYEKSGGFESAGLHVTEDLAISKALFREGFRPIHQVSKACLVKTLSEPDFGSLLLQRKRWMKGAFLLPWYWKIILGFQVAFYGVILCLLLYFPVFGLFLWLVKVGAQSLFIVEIAGKTETKISILELLSFEIYNWLTSWSTVLCYFWPSGIIWKKRYYK